MGTVTVTVVTPTIHPIRDAIVTLSPGDREAETNMFGRARFTDLEPGSYQIHASKEGFGENSITVVVHAGKGASPRLILQPTPEPVPRHVTHEFPGFFSAGFGPAHDPGSQSLEDQGYYECVCDFEVEVPPVAVALVIEAMWEDSVQPPQAPEYRWKVAWENHTVEGQGSSPLRAQVNTTDFPEDFDLASRWVNVSLRPDGVWPTVDQDFRMYVTVFELTAPQPGWRFVSG